MPTGAAVFGAGLVVDVRDDTARPLLVVAGELDLASAGLLTAMLDHVRQRRRRRTGAAPGTRVEVDLDLRRVTFADSSGVSAVTGDGTSVVAASAAVWRVLRLLREQPPVPRAC